MAINIIKIRGRIELATTQVNTVISTLYTVPIGKTTKVIPSPIVTESDYGALWDTLYPENSYVLHVSNNGVRCILRRKSSDGSPLLDSVSKFFVGSVLVCGVSTVGDSTTPTFVKSGWLTFALKPATALVTSNLTTPDALILGPGEQIQHVSNRGSNNGFTPQTDICAYSFILIEQDL